MRIDEEPRRRGSKEAHRVDRTLDPDQKGLGSRLL